jgi:hypothetical protein
MCLYSLQTGSAEDAVDLTLSQSQSQEGGYGYGDDIPAARASVLMELVHARAEMVSGCCFVASSRVVHLSQTTQWTCGHTNALMLLSTFDGLTLFPNLTHATSPSVGLVTNVADVQAIIEAAWADGFDEAGCDALGTLQGTTKWIVATEIVALLRFMNVLAHVVDFELSKFTNPAHMTGVACQWVHNYFTETWPQAPGLYVQDQVFVPPLYLQWRGHSVTIVGVVYNSDDPAQSSILIFDPLQHTARLEQTLRNEASSFGPLLVPAQSLFNKASFQIVFVSPDPLTPQSRDQWRIIVGQSGDLFAIS